MKVLHVIPSISIVHGGPSEAMKLFERACLGIGLDIETVTTDDDGPGKRNGIENGASLIHEGAVRRYFRKTSDTYKVSISLSNWLFKNISQYDVVHIHALFSFSSSAAALIARYKKVPYIIRPLGTLNQYGLENRRSFPKRLSLWMLEKQILRSAAYIHCTSEFEKIQLERLQIPLRVAVIPLATDITAVSDTSQIRKMNPELQGKRWIIFMSRLNPVKNIECMFAAFKIALPNLPDDIYLLLAGDGEHEYKQSLHAQVDALGIGHRVVWAGHLQDDMKVAALCGAELFILPSKSENFGIAAVEAMSLGLPCILSKGVAIAEAAGNDKAALVIDGNDADEMAGQILRLFDDGLLRKELSERASIFASCHYSIEIMGNNLNQLYNNVITQTNVAGRRA